MFIIKANRYQQGRVLFPLILTCLRTHKGISVTSLQTFNFFIKAMNINSFKTTGLYAQDLIHGSFFGRKKKLLYMTDDCTT